MTSWILNIVGMVFIGVILDIILPSGKTSIFIKSIFALFVLYVIVSPLPDLFNQSLTINNSDATVTDLNYLINRNLDKVSALENDLVEALSENGFENVSIIVSADIYNENFSVTKIYVDTYQMVLKDADKHTNSNEEIVTIILSLVDINEEDIVFYG